MPYSVAVGIEEFREGRSPLYIRAVVYVERDSQKRIIIGAKGTRIREVGQSARKKIETFTGQNVYLDLWVKVVPNWRQQHRRARTVRISHGKGRPEMSVDTQLLEILVCPKCKGDLEYREAESSLICHACSLRYPVRDDIPIMLIDEATPL